MRINFPNIYQLQLDHVAFILLALSNFLLSYHLGNDFYWHVKAGELLYQTGALPQGDPFSFTFYGEHWVMHEWLFEYLLYHVYSASGVYGVKLVSALISTLALYIVYKSAVKLGDNKWLSLIIVAGFYFIYEGFGFPRPQLISYLFLAIYAYILIGHKYRLYTVNLYWLPIIMVAWVNMHGGYIIGIVLLILYVISELIDRWLLNSSDKTDEGKLRTVIIFTLLCVLASLFNPYTYHQWIYPFQVSSMSANKYISEWRSPDFHGKTMQMYLILIFTFLFVRSYANTRQKAMESVIPLAFIFLSFISRRHIPIAIIVTVPFFTLAFSQALYSVKSSRISRFFADLNVSRSWGLTQPVNKNYAYTFNWVLLFIVLGGSYYLHKTADHRIDSYVEDYQPVAAVEFIKEAGIKGNVLASYNSGGYLIYHLHPESKVFIDSRMDLYGDSFYNTYAKIIHAEKGWQEAMDKYPIDYILLDNSYSLVDKLDEGNEFTLVYRNYTDSVYVKNSEKFQPLLDRLGKQYIFYRLE